MTFTKPLLVTTQYRVERVAVEQLLLTLKSELSCTVTAHQPADIKYNFMILNDKLFN